MNLIETKLIQILQKLKKEFNAISVKAEFEAENARIDEILKLLHITRKLNMKVAIKIGGCEALKDITDCKQIGCDYVIAPMVETSYALKKYIESIKKIYSDDFTQNTKFLINIETIQSYENLNEMLKLIKKNKIISGFVFGRSDFCSSLNMDKNSINDDKVTEYICSVAKKCKEFKLDLVVGGGVSRDSIKSLKTIKKIKLSRFETRKIIFDSKALNKHNAKHGAILANKFEILWLKYKKKYYDSITNGDKKRINNLIKRWKINC